MPLCKCSLYLVIFYDWIISSTTLKKVVDTSSTVIVADAFTIHPKHAMRIDRQPSPAHVLHCCTERRRRGFKFSEAIPPSSQMILHARHKLQSEEKEDHENSKAINKKADLSKRTVDGDVNESEEIREEDEIVTTKEGENDFDAYVTHDVLLHDDDLMLFDDGPDAYLDESDLALLHNISIDDNDGPLYPPQSKRNASLSGNSTLGTVFPSVISISDLNRISSNLSYFYLRDELGLPEEVMWKITHEAGAALGMTAATIRAKVNVLVDNMKLSKDELSHILYLQPSLLHLSARKNLSPKILFLLRQLDLGKDDLKTLVMGFPAILAYSMNNLNSKIQFYKQHMGYTIDECRELLCSEPKLLLPGVKNGLMPRLRFLVREMEFPIDKVKILCQKYPRILLMSLDNNLRPKLIFYFILTLQMEPHEVLKLLLSYPYFLQYNLDNHIQPTTRYLSSLGFSGREVSRMLLKFPRLITHSLVKIKHVVGYLRYELGLDPADVRRILYQSPQVVGLTTKNLQSKVDFLQDAAAQSSTSMKANGNENGSSTAIASTALRRLIVGMPTLLNLSVESNLRPKVEYLRHRLGIDELTSSLHRLPTLLGYSLDKRIKPRLEAILDADIPGSALTVGVPMNQEYFDAWLIRRAEKAKKMRRNSSSSALVRLEDLQQQLKNGEKSNKIVEAGGRIVHWTRDPP